MSEHFYSENHKSPDQDINVKIIDFSDPNDKEKRESFWMNKVKTHHPEDINYKRINHY